MINLDELLITLGKYSHIINELRDARITVTYDTALYAATVTEMRKLVGGK